MKSFGQFKLDKANGQGIVNFPNGSLLMGEFREDQPWEAIYFDENLNILTRWSNGEEVTSLDNFR